MVEKINTNSECVDFCNFWLDFKLYPYQERFLNYCINEKRVASKWARQSGKSHSVAAYLTYRCVTSKVQVVIVSPTQSQTNELYRKIRNFVNDNPILAGLLVKDTVTEMEFSNGSRILSLPEGNQGKTIRGYTADIIVQEEAGVISDEVVATVITPMIASKPNGQIIKIGTPLGKNHFYRSCHDKDSPYKLITVKWPEVLSVGQYSKEFIEEQQRDLLEVEFRQEYEAEFVEDENAFFPYALVKMTQDDYIYLII